jgi:mRNA interferase MazF
MIQRGDLVTVALQGDFGKPRPALVVQTNLLAELESVIVAPVTSELRNFRFRITIDPSPLNGLRVLSQVMVDKLTAVPRSKITKPFGKLDDARLRQVDRSMLVVLGLA